MMGRPQVRQRSGRPRGPGNTLRIRAYQVKAEPCPVCGVRLGDHDARAGRRCLFAVAAGQRTPVVGGVAGGA